MGGNIRVGEVDGGVHATTMGGDIEVHMVGDPSDGERDVRLDSKSGDIVLALPAGMSMEIDITLAITKSSRRRFQIQSDFDLDIRESDGWDHSQGSPRKYIYGKATIGDGQHRIKIETINGNVRLIRGD